jgi:hypothetical protein
MGDCQGGEIDIECGVTGHFDVTVREHPGGTASRKANICLGEKGLRELQRTIGKMLDRPNRAKLITTGGPEGTLTVKTDE